MSGCAFNPTTEQRALVEAMIGCGESEAEICRLIKNPATGKPISKKMLHEHFPAEITAGAVKVGPLVNNWIVKAILGRGDVKDERLRVQLAICYARTLMGQNEIVTHGRGRVDPRDLAEAERSLDEKLARLARRHQAGETGGPSGG
jgi:hypothetical protein